MCLMYRFSSNFVICKSVHLPWMSLRRGKSSAALELGCNCPRCRRARGSANPIKCKKYPQDELQFKDRYCVSCTNLSQRVWRGRPGKDLDTELNKDECHAEWMSALAIYERDFVVCSDGGTGRVARSKSYSLSFTQVPSIE